MTELFLNPTFILSLVTSFSTVALAFINCKLLKKYDKQHDLSIFYHSYPYRKEVVENIHNIWKDRFNKKFDKVPSMPWQYDKDEACPTITYRALIKNLEASLLIFPKLATNINGSILLLNELDEIIHRICKNKKENSLREEMRKKMNEIHEDQLSVGLMKNAITFPDN